MKNLIKKLKTTVLMVTFAISIGLLGLHIFSSSGSVSLTENGAQTQTGAYRKVAAMSLGNVEVYNYQRMGFTRGLIKFSPDNQYLAVATENNEVLLLTTRGKVLWRKNIGLGKITALQFTPNSSYLLIGETSQEGILLCLSVIDGQEVWRQSSVRELEVDIKGKTYPGIVYITTDESGNIYAVGQRSIKHSDGHSEYRGRIYKFDAQGQLEAMFPHDHNVDAWVSWLSIDRQGDKVVFGTGNWDTTRATKYNNSMYCLDGNLQQILWSKLLDPVVPYRNTTMRASPDMSADGQYIAGMVSDGRCFLHDGQGNELWRRSISEAQKIGGVYINATGLYVQLVDDCVVVTTGNTYNRANWQLPTPVEHPNSNSVFVFDLAGKLVQSCKLGGMIEQMAFQDHKAVFAIGRNVRSKDPSIHGISVATSPDMKEIDHIPIVGPCVGVDISPNGQYIAGIEAPLQLDDGQVIGEYKLILLQQQP